MKKMKWQFRRKTALFLSISLLLTSIFLGIPINWHNSQTAFGMTNYTLNENLISKGIPQSTLPSSLSSVSTATPSSTTTGSGNAAQQLVDKMTLGYNLGDTLDVCIADRTGSGHVSETPAPGTEVDETLWGNPKVTASYFAMLKDCGINTVRIPVTWRDHIGNAPEYAIDTDWMNRVEEVVNYAISQDMYVIINLHHDGGGDPDFGAWIRNAETDPSGTLAKYEKIWSQIAVHFQSYDEHLLFESMNEVGFDNLADTNKQDAFDLLTKLNQSFVDVVRSSGGYNDQRFLYIAGYWTDVEETCGSYYHLPTDTIANHLILSVHYYTPWQFCTQSQPVGSTYYYWGKASDITLMESKIQNLKTTFVDQGIPVIIGEYGVGNNDKDSMKLFCKTLVKLSAASGICACLWDNGGMINRTTYHWKITGLLSAIQKGYLEGKSSYLGQELATFPPNQWDTAATSSPTVVPTTVPNTSSTVAPTGTTSPVQSASPTPTIVPTNTPSTTSTAHIIKTPVIKSLTNQKGKKLVLVIKKPSLLLKGYDIKLSSYKTMKSSTLAKTSKQTKTFAGLKKNKTYYLQIRGYKTYGTKTYYSKWTSIRSITIKK